MFSLVLAEMDIWYENLMLKILNQFQYRHKLQLEASLLVIYWYLFVSYLYRVRVLACKSYSVRCTVQNPALWPPLLLYIPVSHLSLQLSHTKTMCTRARTRTHTHSHTAALAPIIFKHFFGTRPSQHPLLIAHKCYPNQIRLIKNIWIATGMLNP